MKKKGFTLIELLIVVAIIGILAAIAVPNFLNAQMRAKVARAKSDLKAISTGMEMYNMDNNDYPPTHHIWFLTTPIAYLSAIPQDSFPSRLAGGSGQPEGFTEWTWWRYIRGPINEAGRRGTSMCADYYAYFEPFALRSEAVSLSQSQGCPTIWYVKSFGPNVNQGGICGGSAGNGDDCTLRYDPSNGLTSIGDIAVFGPGGMVE